jgi:hypothetical protein
MANSNTPMTAERIMFMIVTFLVVTIPVLIYTGFGIYFLIMDVDVCSSYSPLWIFGVVTFGFIVVSIPARYGLSKIDYGKPTREAFATIHPALRPDWFIWLPVWAAWLVYGGVIIYGGYTCSSMETHGLWVWSLVTFWLNIGVAFIIAVGLLYLAFCRKPSPLSEGTAEETVSLRA